MITDAMYAVRECTYGVVQFIVNDRNINGVPIDLFFMYIQILLPTAYSFP